MNWINKNKWSLISCLVLGALLWYVYQFNVNIGGVVKWFNEYKPDISNIKTPSLPPVWKPSKEPVKDKAADVKNSDSTPIPQQSSNAPKDEPYVPTLSENAWIKAFELERTKN